MSNPYDNIPLTEFWLAHYISDKDGIGLCCLCGNTGIIDTRITAFSPRGVGGYGRRDWCICPNGQWSRSDANGKLPDELEK